MAHITPRTFNWWSVLERGIWTAIQSALGLGVADLVVPGTSLPGATYWWTLGGAAGISFLKTVMQERVDFLDTRREA